MGQVSAVLRRLDGGYGHWCPGCKEMHRIPDSWAFDGNLEVPTFTPSVHISANYTEEWGGPYCCHYFLTAGQLHFCGDCTHELKNQVVQLPVLPAGLTD